MNENKFVFFRLGDVFEAHAGKRTIDFVNEEMKVRKSGVAIGVWKTVTVDGLEALECQRIGKWFSVGRLDAAKAFAKKVGGKLVYGDRRANAPIGYFGRYVTE